jgi:tryptophan synthase
MGVTGSTANGIVSTSLPDQIKRIRGFTSAPLAVGFGVATKEQFDTVAQSGASGVVIGSRIVAVIGEASTDEERAAAVEAYCKDVCSGAGLHPSIVEKEPSKQVLEKLVAEAEPELATIPNAIASGEEGQTLPSRFGDFGGQYVAEALVDSLVELEQAHRSALADPAFWKEFEGLYGYINRPSQLYEAKRLTEHAGGAKIWLK